MNAKVCNVTAQGAGTITFAGGPEWSRGIENIWRKTTGSIYCGGWESLQFAYYSTTAANLVAGWSNRNLGTS